MRSVDDEVARLEMEIGNARFEIKLLNEHNDALRQANKTLRTTIARILRLARHPYEEEV